MKRIVPALLAILFTGCAPLEVDSKDVEKNPLRHSTKPSTQQVAAAKRPSYFGDFSSSTRTEKRIYILRLTYDNGKIALRNVDVADGYPDKDRPDGTYRYDIFSDKKTRLYAARFLDPSSFVITPTPSASGSSISVVPPEGYAKKGEPVPRVASPKPVPREFVVLPPYYYNGDSISFYNPNDKMILAVDVSKYKKVQTPPSKAKHK